MHVLRAELQVQGHAGRRLQTPLRGPSQHRVILLEVFSFTRGARSAVGDVDARTVSQVSQRQAQAGVAGLRYDGRQR